MRSNEEILSEAASGRLVIGDEWPRVREFVLQRLESIVASEFPPPPPRASPSKPLQEANAAKQDSPSQTQAQSQSQSQAQNQTSQSISVTDKENAPPATSSVPGQPPIEFLRPKPFPSPVEIARSTHASIRDTLINEFPHHPPHTFQRLAELVLYPRREYRFLPSYLQALYRTVSVSSTTEMLPLVNPAFANTTPSRGLSLTTSPGSRLVNGTGSSSDASSLTSSLDHDDNLGGALLTPIPWFRGSESPEPDLSHDQTPLFETVIDPEAATNGENEILVNGEEQVSGAEGQASTEPRQRNATEDVEAPHARGPQEIGVEDTGLDPGPGGLAGLVAERLGSPPMSTTSTVESLISGEAPEKPENLEGRREKMDVEPETLGKED